MAFVTAYGVQSWLISRYQSSKRLIGTQQLWKLFAFAMVAVFLMVLVISKNDIKPVYGTCSGSDEISKVRRIDCSNIDKIHLVSTEGMKGFHKIVFEGKYNGVPVVIKYTDYAGKKLHKCLNTVHRIKKELMDEEFKHLVNGCHDMQEIILAKEILLFQELSHPLIIPMIGYCFRNRKDLYQNGLAVVVEKGECDFTTFLPTMSGTDRLTHVKNIAEFLIFLEQSPVGSLYIQHYKDDHFIMHKGILKWIDLDCLQKRDQPCASCPDSLKCIANVCEGLNAKTNMEIFTENKLFQRLLEPSKFPQTIADQIEQTLKSISSGDMDANKLYKEMKSFLSVLKGDKLTLLSNNF